MGRFGPGGTGRGPGGHLLAGHTLSACLVVLLWGLASPTGAAQKDEGDLTVEWPSNNPEIRMLQVMSSIRHRYARTHVTSEIANHVADIKEAVFNFWIPKEASITNFSMVVDDQEYVGEVKEKTQAQRQFQPSSRLRGHITTPHDLSTSRDAHGFRVTVQVPPKKSVTFHLTYEELLRRKRGRYEHVIMLNPEQVIRDLSVDMNIEEPREITSLDVPALRFNASTLSEYTSEVGDVVSISRPTRSSAAISFRPSVRQQLIYSPNGIMGRLFVVYDVKRDLDVGDISTGRNFFMHFFAPVGITTYPKSVLFLVDTSGSMAGPKISQTKTAMLEILASLDQQDTFNIITFSTWLKFWKQDGMKEASSSNIAAAREFINAISVSGGTNMNDALVRGLDMLKHHHISTRSSAIPLIFLLADGEPTSGITNNDLILENVRNGNSIEVRIVTLGYGDDINAQFLQRLASANRGIYRQIHEDADSAIQIQNTFAEVSTLVLKDVRFDYGDSLIEGTQSHSTVPNYWQGSELVVGGYFKDQVSVLVPDIHGYSVNGHMAFNDRIRVRGSQPGADFIERSWALLTINTLLEKAKQTSNSTLKGTSNTRALALALEYSFVTPLTTMVVKNPGQRNTNVGYLRDAPAPARKRGRGNNRGSQGNQGRGVNYPRTTQFVDNDPHFVVQVAGIKESVCFDVSGRPGQVMQLIHDNITGVVVNGLVVGKTPKDPRDHMRTYFGHIQIMSPGNNISATIEAILVNDVRVGWRRAPPRVIEGIEVSMKSPREALFSIAPGLEFTILRHIVNKPNPVKVDFLGFYIKDGSSLSEKTHGLIGQFQHQHVTKEGPPVIIKKKKVVKLKFSGPNSRKHPVKARMRHRRNMEIKRHVPCWHVAHSGEGLIHGLPIDYIVPNLDYRRFCMADKLKDRTFPLFHFS